MTSRLDTALAEIRAARPQAPEELRGRVRLLRPEPRRRLVTRRRLVLVLAAGLLVAAVAAGLLRESGAEHEFAGQGEDSAALEASPPAARDSAAPAPTTGRAVDYRAELGLRVDDLSGATQRAMQVASSLGGFVVSAQYDEGASDSLLVLSVPIGRAQDAIDRLARLGELTSQRFSLQDLQGTIDSLDRQADRLQARIASLERQLRNPALTPGERTALRARLDQAEREHQDVLAQREGTAAQGRMAEISVTLTGEPASEPGSDGVVGRAVDALGTVWAWVLAVLIVGAPFAVLLAFAFLLGRRWRRRANERLLGG